MDRLWIKYDLALWSPNRILKCKKTYSLCITPFIILFQTHASILTEVYVTDYWFWWCKCDECNRLGFSPWGASMFTLLLTGGKYCMCLALWRPKDPRVIAVCQWHHSTLSPFLMVCHCLFVTLEWQQSCIILVFPAALTQCSTTSTMCNTVLRWKEYFMDDLKAHMIQKLL